MTNIASSQKNIFDQKQINNFAEFSDILKRIHCRMIDEGYVIKNGRIIKPKKKEPDVIKLQTINSPYATQNN